MTVRLNKGASVSHVPTDAWEVRGPLFVYMTDIDGDIHEVVVLENTWKSYVI